MKQFKRLLFLVLLTTLVGSNTVLAQEASGNWLKNDGGLDCAAQLVGKSAQSGHQSAQ